MAGVTIEIIKNELYIVNGRVELKDEDGNANPQGSDGALPLRCVDHQAICDGTHSKTGFQAAEKAMPGSAQG